MRTASEVEPDSYYEKYMSSRVAEQLKTSKITRSQKNLGNAYIKMKISTIALRN